MLISTAPDYNTRALLDVQAQREALNALLSYQLATLAKWPMPALIDLGAAYALDAQTRALYAEPRPSVPFHAMAVEMPDGSIESR